MFHAGIPLGGFAGWYLFVADRHTQLIGTIAQTARFFIEVASAPFFGLDQHPVLGLILAGAALFGVGGTVADCWATRDARRLTLPASPLPRGVTNPFLPDEHVTAGWLRPAVDAGILPDPSALSASECPSGELATMTMRPPTALQPPGLRSWRLRRPGWVRGPWVGDPCGSGRPAGLGCRGRRADGGCFAGATRLTLRGISGTG